MTGKADIRKWDKKKRRIDSRNTVNSYQESRATKFTPQGSGNSELIRPQSESDLNMNTFDIINLDRMIFATEAGAGDTIAVTEYGIEAISNGTSAAYGLKFQIPSGKIHTFNVGSVAALVVSDSAVVATVDMTTANINLGSHKIKYQEISTPSPNPAANEGFMYSKDVSGVTTPMWLDSAGTETSLLGGGSSGAGLGDNNVWTGTNQFNGSYVTVAGTFTASGASTTIGDANTDIFNLVAKMGTDINMSTYDITNVDRLKFSTTAGSGSALGSTDTGIEALFNSGSPYGMIIQFPSTNSAVMQIKRGITDMINISSLGVLFGDELLMGGHKITNLGTPTSTTDAATKAYVDASGGGWVGTATSTLDMNNFDIEDVNALKINSGAAGSADSFTMFGTSTAGAINLVDDTDTFNIQVDGTSRLTISDSLVTSSVPISATAIQDVGHIYLDGAGTNDLLIDGTIDGLDYKVPTGDFHRFYINSVERMKVHSTHVSIENYIDVRSPTTTSPTNTAYTGIVGWFKIKIAGGDYRMPVWNAP